MPQDISKASLIPYNKWDTSTEEMGATRTQEEDPKKNKTTLHTRIPQEISKASLIPSNKWDTSVEEMGVIRTQEEPKQNVVVKFQVSSSESGRSDGVLRSLNYRKVPLLTQEFPTFQKHINSSNKWDTSAEEMGVTRTQKDRKKNVAVKFQVSSPKWEGVREVPLLQWSVFVATAEDQPDSEVDFSEERS
ncbi:hypothetical protein CEXT_69561 [Caerostris extrusa]|uniref:Uncharacterized protein n=1 Tax=Caerostris extrusa TaxID=172846 RepID=A0AAV4TF55_CAEEX|nr:hypothetical protein CEXT_69561 [Caerostris extrusa]